MLHILTADDMKYTDYIMALFSDCCRYSGMLVARWSPWIFRLLVSSLKLFFTKYVVFWLQNCR